MTDEKITMADQVSTRDPNAPKAYGISRSHVGGLKRGERRREVSTIHNEDKP